MTAGPGHVPLDPSQCQALHDWLAAGGAHHGATAGYQGSVHVYRGRAGAFVIKEPLGRGLRGTLSRAAIRHEARVYRRLQGIAGIPKCFGWIDGRYLVLEHIQGHTLDAVEGELRDREAFFAMLLDVLKLMHESGVAHGDLKRKKNILVGPGQQPFVIDFGIAVVERDRWGFLFEVARQVDYNAWIKHKYRGRTSGISPADAPFHKPMRLEGVMRVMRVLWQTATLRWLRKQRRQSRRN